MASLNDVEQALYNMIEQEGTKAPIQVLIRVLTEYSHTMSDMGLKEQARSAYEMSDILRDVIME